MPTPHNTASPGQIASTVLMPGDPLRAKFIAEHFLENPVQFNSVRGMLGFTGLYKGVPVSVMGSGMGMPSIGIYSYELYSHYDVDNIIRVGSAGAYDPDLKLFDVLLVTSAWSESTYAHTQGGYTEDVILPSPALNDKLRKSAATAGHPITEGRIHSSDVFYRQPTDSDIPYWQIIRDEKGLLAVEMESFALFHNAAVCGKNAACVLTISDSLAHAQETTAEEREKSFTHMMEIALGTVLL